MFGEQSSIVVCFLKETGDGGRGGVFVFMRSTLKSPSEAFPRAAKEECWGLVQSMLGKYGPVSAASNLHSQDSLQRGPWTKAS